MDRLTLLETFAIALDEGSLNRAARRRGITQSAVSQQIKQLETSIGQQLLHRTARGIHATRAGDLVYVHAQTLLSGYNRMTAELDQLENSVSGTFRISVSSFLGRSVIGPMLIEMNAAHPDLNIVMRLEDRLVDVVREGYDLAIRTGRLGDTDGFGRKISALDTVLVATPAYLDRVGRPAQPEDMKRLDFIQHHEDQTKGFFPLRRDGREYPAPVRVGFTADDPDLIMRAVASGSGYTRVPRFMVADEIASGALEVVLPAYRPPNKDVFAVYPSRHTPDRRRDLTIENVVARFEALRDPQAGPDAITA
ncbi:LysR family transcriptional regulator [Ruegeria pomeroyi]|uniref:Transcriptional regulator, LysR family n=2 Tax=Ruegeria pomeroyi TaxID=89184 RepID=Q5LRF7_RUEPO|nr:LysR family transcriptional regulator [Ruegeria pomeroyi]AAV95439.1 transcriptional regulator, LysR family [Ruegeria pomeroyi DSS-3]NVK96857.1 LysR family transcriptional regulator [Ruegeria pomeroyi]NVL01935.1 LysR family transcriptional regulator [Ruegeria pomeroyi]QWV09005.1 LysR family transcriptional regulator [Ruegeria pomeroyi]